MTAPLVTGAFAPTHDPPPGTKPSKGAATLRLVDKARLLTIIEANKHIRIWVGRDDALPATPEALSDTGTNMPKCLLYTNLNIFLFIKHPIEKAHHNTL